MDLKAKKAVKKVEKKTITMAEIRAYKFDESLNDVVTETESLIAKTLIEKYDLWNVYRVAGGAGIRAKMKDLGLGGHSKTNYRPHAGNIFVYMSNNFSAQEIKEKLRIKFKDFAEMSIDPDDFMEGKVSSRTLAMAYGTMLKNRRVASGTSVEVILASL
jgi:pyruvate dehydrogenase complex dehydrogenase (E1) component